MSAKEIQSAQTPDVAVACGDQAAASVQAINSPGFVTGKAPYSSDMLGNGGSNTGVVPLLVPDNADNCRLIVRMDAIHDPGEPELVEFEFDTKS